jgi:hypothetical protein
MPNRYVRESAIESERVDKLSWAGEVFWRRLINRVDDFGRYTANPDLLRASLFPLRVNKVSAADIGKWLSECETADLVSAWKGNDGKHYLVMHRWEGGRAKTSRYPDPPEAIRLRLQAHVNGCKQAFADPPDPDPDPDSDRDTAGKSRKGRKTDPHLPETGTLYEFWKKRFPASTRKKDALLWIGRRLEAYSVERLAMAIHRYRLECTKKETEEQYLKDCANFFGEDAAFERYLPDESWYAENLDKARADLKGAA